MATQKSKSKVKKVAMMDPVLEFFSSHGYPNAAIVNPNTVIRIESLKSCDIQLKRYANKANWIFLVFGRSNPEIRKWSMDVAEKVGNGMFADLKVQRGNPDKAGDGDRSVVAFDSSVAVNLTDSSSYETLLKAYEKLRGKLFSDGILESKPTHERMDEYIPTIEEIRHVLDNVPNAIRKDALRFNVFDIIGVARMEIRHSNVLAWLLDPAAEHGFGKDLIKALLVRAGAVKLANEIDLESFVIKREWNHIDLLLKSEKEKAVVAIENKIGAHEGVKNGESQLTRYKKTIADVFANWKLEKTGRQILIYLTPDGVAPTRGNEAWRIVSYGNLLSDVERLYLRRKAQGPLDRDVDGLIKNYIETIKRNVLMKIDPQLKTECRKFYRDNKKVLDFVFNYGKSGLADDVDEVLTSLAAEKKIAHDPQFDSAIEFTVPALDKLFTAKAASSSIRGYKCCVDGVSAASGHVCVVMVLSMTEDEELNESVRKFRKKFTGGDWKKTKAGEYQATMDLPWFDRKGKFGVKNWKDFSFDSAGATLSDAVRAAVTEFVDVGVPKLLAL